MEVTLMEHEEIQVRREVGTQQVFRVEVTLATLHYLGSDPEGVSRLGRLMKVLKRISGTDKWMVEFAVELRNDNSVDIQVKGEVLSCLQRMIYPVYSEKGLKLEVTLQAFVSKLNHGGGGRQVERVCVMDVRAKGLKAVDNGHGVYLQKRIGNYGGDKGDREDYQCQLTIQVDLDDWVELEERSPHLLKRDRLVLEKGICVDFEVVARDGTRFPCHKVFLAESPVLQKLAIFTNLDKNEVHFPDLNSKALYGFLEFIYFGGIGKPLESPGICLELLAAGYKYELPDLEASMKKIILQKSCSWWTREEAVEVYNFLQDFNGGKDAKEELAKKVIRILEWNQKKIQNDLKMDN